MHFVAWSRDPDFIPGGERAIEVVKERPRAFARYGLCAHSISSVALREKAPFCAALFSESWILVRGGGKEISDLRFWISERCAFGALWAQRGV
jgi:hypothetical protein